ncbi:MAG: SpaH/EbpB family LPXTG-anchored major pilin [Clostridiales bacterium]|nr:SpaH/EbpB family LPXTG-anchored major pilin [Clostridiales bacterium]
MKRKLKQVFWAAAAVLLTVMGACGSALPSQAAESYLIDQSKKGSITICKYDAKDNETAIEGVEFTYLYCGAAETYSVGTTDRAIELVYEVPVKLCRILGLAEADAYDMDGTAFPCTTRGVRHYSSTQITEALQAALEGSSGLYADNLMAKNALEDYVTKNRDAVPMTLTDADGKTEAENLEPGLYLIVETKVPEEVTETVNPWFAALPYTDADSDAWSYDLTCIPKNQTGEPDLEKLVRNASENVDGTDANTKNYDESATATEGDTLSYLLVSKLPHIHSRATSLKEYTFSDTLSEGMTYNQDAKIAFYTSADAARSNDLTQAAEVWEEPSPSGKMYRQVYQPLGSGQTRMIVSMTEEGLRQINEKWSDYYIVVFYTADFHSDETVVLGDEGNRNDVTLRWRRTSHAYYDTLTDYCYVFTYGVDLTKQFSGGSGDARKVCFRIQNVTDGYYLQAESAQTGSGEKIYYITGKCADRDSATQISPGADGHVYINGLEGDEYQITEIATDEGYQLLKEPVCLTIVSAVEKEGVLTPSSVLVDGQEAVLKDYVALRVVNHRKMVTPKTGDDGAGLYTAAGLLAVGAGLLVLRRKVRQNHETAKRL